MCPSLRGITYQAVKQDLVSCDWIFLVVIGSSRLVIGYQTCLLLSLDR